MHPGLSEELLPSPDGIDLIKLKKDTVVTTDTCNTARKLRRVLVEMIKDATDGDGEIFEFDCMNHLRNVWFGGMEKAVTQRLNAILRGSLDQIDPRLRVSASLSAIIRAVDNEFSLSANYPKGHGQLFLEWIREYYPGVFLMHVERTSGSRQDLCTEGAMAIFWNYPYWIEFLDTMLRKPPKQKGQEASILQQSLFVALSSEEMIALSCLFSIMHISVCMPFRWLSGKTHELAKYKWGPMNMSHVIDTLYGKMLELEKKPQLILDKDFMMDIFAEYRSEDNGLPPFIEYWTHMFVHKKTGVVARKSGTREVPLARLMEELFYPTRKTVKSSSTRLKELAKVAAAAIIAELVNKKKATHHYLSATMPPSPYAWRHCSDKMKEAMLGKTATNDIAESTLGGTTKQLENFTTIHFSGAAAVNDSRRNKHFDTYHKFDERLADAVMHMCIRDAQSTRQQCNDALESQAKARHQREELLMDVAYDKATEKYLEDTMYYRLYKTSSCWKGNPNIVGKKLSTLKSDASRLQALKDNITIRVRGFNWSWAHHAWSKNGELYTVKDLKKHLEFVIRRENEEGIPKPPDVVNYQLERKDLPTLGKPISEMAALGKKQKVALNKFKKRADAIELERDDNRKGENSIFRRQQHWDRPNVADLINERIDMLYNIVDTDVEEEKVLRWCQGEVVEVYEKRNKVQSVRILWDPLSNDAEYNDYTESDEVIDPKLWNVTKEVEGAWRMDIDIRDVGEDESHGGDAVGILDANIEINGESIN